jgi:hypothetical protein
MSPRIKRLVDAKRLDPRLDSLVGVDKKILSPSAPPTIGKICVLAGKLSRYCQKPSPTMLECNEISRVRNLVLKPRRF